MLKPWYSKVGTAFILALTAGCASSPLGRKQLTLIPSSQMNQMGIQSFEQMKRQLPIERDPATQSYVRCIAHHVIEASQGQSGIPDWEIVVFKDSTPNAFALPGGKIGVHTGMLSVAKNDAQLAAVLGHEVGHVMANHGNERVSQGLLAQGGLAVADLLSGNTSGERKKILMAGLAIGAQYGAILPFSRSHESEADLIGLDLMARAGFDPRQSVELWKNMAAASGGRSPPEFMSTHPAPETRIASLNQNLPIPIQKYESAIRGGLLPRCNR